MRCNEVVVKGSAHHIISGFSPSFAQPPCPGFEVTRCFGIEVVLPLQVEHHPFRHLGPNSVRFLLFLLDVVPVGAIQSDAGEPNACGVTDVCTHGQGHPETTIGHLVRPGRSDRDLINVIAPSEL
jgi:hypothetical protein